VWSKTGINGQQGYDDWWANFGATAGNGSSVTGSFTDSVSVPEPTSLVLLALGGLLATFVFVPPNQIVCETNKE
jgi:hypothetical protein